MIIEVKKEDIYIPEFGGNRDLPESEQLQVKHRFLLPGERKKYIYTKPLQINKLTGKMSGDVEFIQDEQGITKAVVNEFVNFKLSVDGKEIEIKTPAEMYENPAPVGLVTEIETAMLLASPEVDKDFL
jgi:hypothetical protein